MQQSGGPRSPLPGQAAHRSAECRKPAAGHCHGVAQQAASQVGADSLPPPHFTARELPSSQGSGTTQRRSSKEQLVRWGQEFSRRELHPTSQLQGVIEAGGWVLCSARQ